MNILEWIGIVAIIGLVISVINKTKNRDPEAHLKNYEFKEMAISFGDIEDLSKRKFDIHNENINHVQSALDTLIQTTVPLPKESFASDYRAKRVEYEIILLLSNCIIEHEEKNKDLHVDNLKIK